MNLPFTKEQFLENFKSYNDAVFPLQIVFFLLACLMVYLAIKKARNSDKLISALLVFFWLWVGVVYHIIFFSTINKAAYIFGAFFILEGLLFFIFGIWQNKIQFHFELNKYSKVGLLFIFYALVIYPLLGYFFGHVYPHNPTFGVPCPTTIFTFGLLLMTARPLSRALVVIPLLWSLISLSAATSLGIREDLGLLVAGVVGTILIWQRERK